MRGGELSGDETEGLRIYQTSERFMREEKTTTKRLAIHRMLEERSQTRRGIKKGGDTWMEIIAKKAHGGGS